MRRGEGLTPIVALEDEPAGLVDDPDTIDCHREVIVVQRFARNYSFLPTPCAPVSRNDKHKCVSKVRLMCMRGSQKGEGSDIFRH